jgi:hypothetical protein
VQGAWAKCSRTACPLSPLSSTTKCALGAAVCTGHDSPAQQLGCCNPHARCCCTGRRHTAWTARLAGEVDWHADTLNHVQQMLLLCLTPLLLWRTAVFAPGLSQAALQLPCSHARKLACQPPLHLGFLMIKSHPACVMVSTRLAAHRGQLCHPHTSFQPGYAKSAADRDMIS